jgi:general secretion pathway protein G
VSKRTRRSRARTLGFTLIELMVVVVIIGILAAIVVPRFTQAGDDAKVAAAKAQINSLKSALDMYKLKVGDYPSTSEGLELLISNEYQNFLDAETIPLDPWGNPYLYTSPGESGRDYEIISYGADRTDGGEGYDADIVSWDLARSGG